jgi:hypothetical protein
MVRSRICRALGTTAVLVLAFSATATADVARYTNPAATATSGDCSIAFPCRIDYAIEGASDGDNVVVAPGEYQVDAPIVAPAIDIVGDPGPRPVLVGASTLTSELLSFRNGGTLRHLTLRGTAPGMDSLVLEDGTGEDLEIVSVAGDGAKLVGSMAPTVLRDTVVRTEIAGGGSAALKLRNPGGGDVALRNVTAIAPDATAIRCDIGGGSQATIVNTIARGGAADVDGTIGATACIASYSNLRAELSPSLTLGDGIQSEAPVFADAANHDFRPLEGSPTIDAGTADALTGTTDPDGRERGATPDIGAFECCGEVPPVVTPTPTPTATATPTPSHGRPEDKPKKDKTDKEHPTPSQGETIVVSPGNSRILVRKPGNAHFVPLEQAVELPVGTVVDAKLGRIQLSTQLDDGTVQTGTFWGSRFKILQSPEGSGMTSLALRGGNFRRCPRRAGASLAHTSGVAREYPKRKVVRRLWARDRGGRFRTYGNNSVATARGTKWVTRDRCDGTATRVFEGSVAVRDKRRHKTVIVRAGHRYLAHR